MINNFKLIRDLKPGSVFLAEDKQGKRWVLKKSPHTPQIVKFSEVVHRQGGGLAAVMPEFFGDGDYLRQKFLTWQLAGDTVKTYGTEDSSFEHMDAEEMGRVIGELQRFDLPAGRQGFTDPSLETRSADFYLKNIDEFKPALVAEFGADFFAQVEQFLLSRKDLVDQYSHFLSNGDLHPQNIMYEGSKFMLIDWDLLHFNNPGWDLCDLYVWGWRNREWGEKLLNAYKKNLTIPLADFEAIFAFDVVYLTSQLIKHAKFIQAPAEFLEAQKKMLEEYLA